MIIFRYLSKEVYSMMLGVLFILLLILLSAQFLHYLNWVTQGRLTFTVLLKIVGLEVPLLIGYVLPLSFFLGVLLAIGRLCEDRELMVMSACGVSHAKMMGMVGLMALGAALVAGLFMFIVEPAAQWDRIKLQQAAITAYSVHKILPGQFQNIPSNHMLIYVANTSKNHNQLNHVFAHVVLSKDKAHRSERTEIITATSASEWMDSKTLNNFLVLNNGYRYIGASDQLNDQLTHFNQYRMRLNTISSQLSESERVKFLPTLQLWKLRARPLMSAEWQWRVGVFLSVLILGLLAVPLAYVDPRKGKFGKFFPAIILYLIYVNMMFVSRSWIAHNTFLGRTFGMWWLHGLFFIIALLYTAKHVGWRRFISLGRCV